MNNKNLREDQEQGGIIRHFECDNTDNHPTNWEIYFQMVNKKKGMQIGTKTPPLHRFVYVCVCKILFYQ